MRLSIIIAIIATTAILAVLLAGLVSSNNILLDMAGSSHGGYSRPIGRGERTAANEGRLATGSHVPGMNLQMAGGGSGGGSGFNYLMMLNHLLTSPMPTDAESIRVRQLIELYFRSYRGDFDSQQMHDEPIRQGRRSAPSSLYGTHFRETSNATFLSAERIGQPDPVRIGSVISLEYQTGNLIRTLYPNWQTMMNNRVSSVWVDNGGDGLPDGEFQLEQGGGQGQRNHLMPVGATSFDVFSITHQMNLMHHNTHLAHEWLGAYASNTTLLISAASTIHNRGRAGIQIFASGMPYWGDDPRSRGHAHRSIHNLTNRDVLRTPAERDIAFFNLFTETIQRHGWRHTQFSGQVNLTSQNIGLLIALANGWYIERYASGQMVSGSRNQTNLFLQQMETWIRANFDNAPPANIVQVLFPNQFQSADQMIDWIRNERVSTAGEVILRQHGIPIATTDTVLGTQDGSHWRGSQGALVAHGITWNFIFYVSDTMATPGFYVNAQNSFPWVMTGDAVGFRNLWGPVLSDGDFIRFAMSAGMSEALVNQSIIDPTNPQQFFNNVGEGGFSQVAGQSRLIVPALLTRLGYDLNTIPPGALEVLIAAHAISGGHYTQNAWGTRLVPERWYGTGGAVSYIDLAGGSAFLRNWSHWGHGFQPEWRESIGVDCMVFIHVASQLNIGLQRTGIVHSGSSSQMWNGAIGTAARTHTLDDGTEWDARWFALDASGNILPYGQQGPAQRSTLWEPHLRPGDIMVARGHGEFFFGFNQTNSAVTITAQESLFQVRGESRDWTAPPGRYFFIGSAGTGNNSGIHRWTTWQGNDVRNWGRNDSTPSTIRVWRIGSALTPQERAQAGI